MKTIETLMAEIKAEAQKAGDQNVQKADRLLEAISLMDRSIQKAVETMKAFKELVRPMTHDDIKERDGGTL